MTPNRSSGIIGAASSASRIIASFLSPSFCPWLLIISDTSYHPGGRSGRVSVIRFCPGAGRSAEESSAAPLRW